MDLAKQDVIAALGALAQETRLDVFRALVRAGGQGMAAGAISRALSVPCATLSFHLKEMKNAKLVRSERKGRSLIYSADFAAMTGMLAYLSENCCESDASGCGPATSCEKPAPPNDPFEDQRSTP